MFAPAIARLAHVSNFHRGKKTKLLLGVQAPAAPASHCMILRRALEVVSRRLSESQEIIKQLSSYTAEQRISAALLRLVGKLGEARGENVLIQLPFSRQDLAAMTGVTVETVSRAMSRFSEEGLIKSGRK
jgi:CRP-like cAMP-binding protein